MPVYTYKYIIYRFIYLFIEICLLDCLWILYIPYTIGIELMLSSFNRKLSTPMWKNPPPTHGAICYIPGESCTGRRLKLEGEESTSGVAFCIGHSLCG